MELDSGTISEELDAGSPALEAGALSLETGALSLDTGALSLEAGTPALETSTFSLEPGTASAELAGNVALEPGTFSESLKSSGIVSLESGRTDSLDSGMSFAPEVLSSPQATKAANTNAEIAVTTTFLKL